MIDYEKFNISIIVAINNRNGIGIDNQMLYNIPEDLKYFKEKTMGHFVIMGSKTFQSINGPLKGRKNAILTRNRMNFFERNEELIQKSFVIEPKIIICHRIEELFELMDGIDYQPFVIGGAEVYRQFLPYTKTLYLTRIDDNAEADTFFPEINYDDWNLISSLNQSNQIYNYKFEIYQRKK